MIKSICKTFVFLRFKRSFYKRELSFDSVWSLNSSKQNKLSILTINHIYTEYAFIHLKSQTFVPRTDIRFVTDTCYCN